MSGGSDTSERVLARAHWLGVVDARPLALFRVLLGLVLLADLAAWAPHLDEFLSDGGVFPPGTPGTGDFGLYTLAHSGLALRSLYAATVAAAVAWLLGFHARLAAAVCWVLVLSLHKRLGPIRTGGDVLIDLMLLHSIFAEVAGVWSVDALRRGARPLVRALVPRLMQSTLALLYLYTAIQKLRLGGQDWLHGPVVFQHLHLHGWVRPGGAWLREHPALCQWAASGTIALELLVPALLLWPSGRARLLAILSHLAIQLGILLCFKVGNFTEVMLACTALWVPGAWLDRLGGPFRRLEGPRPPEPWTSPAAIGALGLAVLYAPVAVRPLEKLLPERARWQLYANALQIQVGLFTHSVPSRRWEAIGALADGAAVDPLPVALPGARFDEGLRNSPWMQLPYRDVAPSALGPLVCRRWSEARPAAPLRSWTLAVHVRPVPVPGAPLPPERRRVLFTQACAEGQGMRADRIGDPVP